MLAIYSSKLYYDRQCWLVGAVFDMAGARFDGVDRSTFMVFIPGVLPGALSALCNTCGAGEPTERNGKTGILRVRVNAHYQGAYLVEVTV